MKPYVRILVILAGLLSAASEVGAVGSTLKSPLWISQSPVGMVVVTVNGDGRNQFFEKLKEFAKENQFTSEIEGAPPDDESFIIQMYRRDMMIIGANWPDDMTEFDLGFYRNNSPYNSDPLPQAKVDAMMAALRESLRQINGVTAEIRQP